MTSRYLGLVVVPGKYIVRIEVEEFVSQRRGREKQRERERERLARGQGVGMRVEEGRSEG